MHILQPSKEDLQRLSSDDLEELVLLLCECDLKKHGGKITSVKRLGDLNTSDGGIDVKVEENLKNFSTEFIPCNDTGFQVKKNAISPNEIKSEMSPKGQVLKSISNLNDNAGAYILVFPKPLSQNQFENRINAMKEEIAKFGSKKLIHIDIYDLSKLHQWLRQHLSVMIWVNQKVGKNTIGWLPYDRWSLPPKNDDDQYIFSDEPSVILPSPFGKSYPNIIGLDLVRKAILGSTDALRINGLTGVGKTRFVQALFEESINSEPLDRTKVIYCDVSTSPSFTPESMIDLLIVDNLSPIIVLDNCPLETHVNITKKLSSTETGIRLISIDYQVNEVCLNNTLPVEIFSSGPKVAKTILMRRYPDIGEFDSFRIATLAKGNSNLTRAVMDRFKYDKNSLSNISETHLFDKLFFQRNYPDDEIRKIAGVLSLVDSFSINENHQNQSELEVLAELTSSSFDELCRIVKKLKDRGIVRNRGDSFHAIEPTVLANQLVNEALNEISIPKILNLFEKDSNIGLLTAFSRRLRYLHDNREVQKIVNNWFNLGGILSDSLNLDKYRLEIIENISPVNSKLSFETIQKALNSKNFKTLVTSYSDTRQPILNLLVRLAYETDKFESCAKLLIKIAKFDDTKGETAEVRDMLFSLFQPILSGSRASIDQMKQFVEQLMKGPDCFSQDIGFSVLDKILSKANWYFNEILGFGAQPLGDEIIYGQISLKEWYMTFLDLIAKYANDSNDKISSNTRGIFVRNIIWLAQLRFIGRELEDLIKAILQNSEWPELWVEVRRWINTYKESKFQSENEICKFLVKLEKIVHPKSLNGEITAYVLKSKFNTMYLDDSYLLGNDSKFNLSDVDSRINEKCTSLGKKFVESDGKIANLGNEIFEYRESQILPSFGKGLAKVVTKISETWLQLVTAFESSKEENPNPAVICGFIESVDQIDTLKSRALLAEVSNYPKLTKYITDLYPRNSFTEEDLKIVSR